MTLNDIKNRHGMAAGLWKDNDNQSWQDMDHLLKRLVLAEKVCKMAGGYFVEGPGDSCDHVIEALTIWEDAVEAEKSNEIK